jgi:uncharacterized protein DUF3891
MLLRPDGDAVIAIGQPAHAWISGQLARAWGNERFGAVQPRDEVLLAAEQHDAGMAAWDAAPELNPRSGRPYAFTEMPLATHLGLWGRAPGLVRVQSPYAALLVSMHGTALYEMRELAALSPGESRAVRAYLDGQHRLQARLREELAVSAPEAHRNQRLLWTWDYLSLAVCLDWVPGVARAVPSADGPEDVRIGPAGPGRLALEPWPFGDERVSLRCDGRRLEGRFEDLASMRAALEAAPWTSLRWELEPAVGG